MQAYDSLSTFPDVKPALARLAQTPGFKSVVFSNGTMDMVSASVNKSPDLAPHAGVFESIVVVEEVRRFKPDPETYYHLAGKVGKEKSQMKEMWLVSGNPFDIVGARHVGMRAIWVDRAGAGWVDSLGDAPTVVVKSLEEVVEKVKGFAEG